MEEQKQSKVKVMVNLDGWMSGIGQYPRGVGYWCFGTSPDERDANAMVIHEFGLYSEAKAQAIKKAQDAGYTTIYLWC